MIQTMTPFSKATSKCFAHCQRNLAVFNSRTTPKEFFEYLQVWTPDPWKLSTAPGEKKRYRNTLSMLPKIPKARALEIGCGIGIFTKLLAKKVRRLSAIDISELAIREAAKKCAKEKNITFHLADILAFKNKRKFDLILCAEVLYYIPLSKVSKARRKILKLLSPGGYLITVQPKVSPWEDFFLKSGQVHLIKTKLLEKNSKHRACRISLFAKAGKPKAGSR